MRFQRRLTLFGWRYDLFTGKRKCVGSLASSRYKTTESAQATTPQCLGAQAGKTFWLFEDRFYSDDEDLTPEDVVALVRDRERRRQRRLERARVGMIVESSDIRRRPSIPREVKLAVFERDGGRCVECGSSFEIQYDHVIPFSQGGSSTVENLQLLCADCSQRKGASIA